MSQRFEGHNLEEALQQASQTLGVDRWQLTYHVLLQKRGFLGGVKRIVIEAEVNEAAPPPAAPQPYTPVADARPASPPRRERGGGGPRERGGRGGRGGDRGDRGGRESSRGRGRGGDGRGRGRGDRGSTLRVGDFEAFLGEIPAQGPESDAARMVREWCESVLTMSKLDVTVRSEENDTQILLRMYGADAPRLTDRHGELLDAIQVLANKALVGRKVEKEIELDCAEFKERRMEDLERRAFAVADRVRRAGREELLPAMSPIERRIIHLALRDDRDVTTESRGEGFFKRVAILLRSEPLEPEQSAEQPTPEP